MTLSKYATKTMTIAKPGKDEIDKRINEKLALQNKVDLRLSNLENICLRAGIEPLTIEHIQGFLFEIDERYEIKLKVLIDAEIKRSEAVKARVEAETRKEVAEEQNQDPMPFIKNEAPQSQEVQERVNKLIENQKEVPVTTNEKVTKTISMQVNVKANIPDELVLKHIFGLIGNDVDKFIQMFKVS
jgi:ribosomal protein L17